MSQRQPAPAPLRVCYQRCPALSDDKAHRRVQLAYALLLGLQPWPDGSRTAARTAALHGVATDAAAETMQP